MFLLPIVFVVGYGLLLAGWIRASIKKQISRSFLLGFLAQVVMVMLLAYSLEIKRKGTEALWRHNVGTTLVSTANALNDLNKAQKVQDVILTTLKGDTKISYNQLQELSAAMSALEISANAKTGL